MRVSGTNENQEEKYLLFSGEGTPIITTRWDIFHVHDQPLCWQAKQNKLNNKTGGWWGGGGVTGDTTIYIKLYVKQGQNIIISRGLPHPDPLMNAQVKCIRRAESLMEVTPKWWLAALLQRILLF